MAVLINGKPLTPAAPPKQKKPKYGHTKARPYQGSLNEPGRFRIANWMSLLNISHSALYARMKYFHRYPLPPADGCDGRPFWNTETVRNYLNG
jgi:hypothetical protein